MQPPSKNVECVTALGAIMLCFPRKCSNLEPGFPDCRWTHHLISGSNFIFSKIDYKEDKMEQLFICWQFSYIVTIRPILHTQIFVIKQTGYYIQGQNKLNISIISQPKYACSYIILKHKQSEQHHSQEYRSIPITALGKKSNGNQNHICSLQYQC